MFKILSDLSSDENKLPHLPLDEIARLGAKKLLAEALELEVQEYVQAFSKLRDENGHTVVVRNGKGRERTVITGSGSFPIKAPRVNDKRPEKKFESKILPPYLRKSPKIDSILPILYLKGLSGNAFNEALEGLLGEGRKGLSPASISALKKNWEKDLAEWKGKPINEEFVYIWADGVNVSVRLGEDKRVCLLVLIGANELGEKKLLAVEAGYRESSIGWKGVFSDLIERGLKPPKLIIGDGALGLWKAVREIDSFKGVGEQRCWVHKTANVLDKLPKKAQGKAKSMIHEMAGAPTKKDAEKTLKVFKETFEAKYPKAVITLEKDWSKLTAFFDFPAANWTSIRTTNPIESAFATVKLRTKSTKGAGSAKRAKLMAFKLLKEAEKKWRPIRGWREIPNVIENKVYKDGEIVEESANNQEVVA